ncbi:MAG: outer membrane beta-barrel protein [Hyphomicrobiales bacterium]|nr:outer membrane beta-barrel protein [Hyphomicrobiales bacterium]
MSFRSCKRLAFLAAGYAAITIASPALLHAQESTASPSVAAMLGSAVGGPTPEQGIVVGGWLVNPSITTSAILTDNVNATPTNRRSALGLSVVPALEAVRDWGIHKTSVYAFGEGRFYPFNSQTTQTATYLTGDVGIAHQYQPFKDLTIQFVADARRSSGLFQPYIGGGSLPSFLPNSNVVTGVGSFVNQFSGGVSVRKDITERTFVSATASAQYVTYDTPNASPFGNLVSPNLNSYSALNGGAYTAALRAGFYLTPQIYAFVEPSADLRRYQSAWNDSNGLSIRAGLGSDLIGLFRGEIYAGYSRQTSVYGHFGALSAPSFGAHIFYYPTRYLTLSAAIDSTLTVSALQPNASAPFANLALNGVAAAGRTFQARLQAEYALSTRWSAYARGGYGQTVTSSVYGSSATKIWSAGLGLKYHVWRGLSMAVDYQFNRSFSRNQLIFAAYSSETVSANTLSIGLNYRY